MNRKRIAMVVQRAGTEVNGGAEALCREVARAMQSVWDVTILTTTALEYTTWKPHYPEGIETLDGVEIRRFDVDRTRNSRYFDQLSSRMLSHLSTAPLAEQEEWMRAQGPYSTKLLQYIEEHRDDYDYFIFYTYLYAQTYFGLPLVADKAFLAPFGHDEWPIHMPMWDEFFKKPQRIIFSTVEERAFLQRRFPNADLAGPVVGMGVEVPEDADPHRFRHRFGIQNPYAIYVGRIDTAKRCDQLLSDFSGYKKAHQDDLILVLLGRAEMAIPVLPFVRTLGYVPEDIKMDAIAGSEFLVMPSALESLSIALLEAWSVARPVLVNASSDVLVGQSRRANAGLWYSDSAEFTAATQILRSETSKTLGENGRAFVQSSYTWPVIVRAYEDVLAAALAETSGAAAGG